MQDQLTVTENNKTIEEKAARQASIRANSGRWDLNIAVFLFLILILVIILLFQGIGIAIVAPTAIFGLTCVWLLGWQRGKKLYAIFYNEELVKLKQESTVRIPEKEKLQDIIEETIEEQVQKALLDRRFTSKP